MSGPGQLKRLFETCDRNKRGWIGRHEFGELCASFDIGYPDCEAIFDDLDRDGDERISFDDFASGFREFLTPSPAELSDKRRRRQSATTKQLTQRFGEDRFVRIRRSLTNSAEKLYTLYDEIQQPNSCTDGHLAAQFEQLIEQLVCDVTRFEQEREKVEQLVQREREQHQQRLKILEDELEVQVQRVAATAKQETERKCDAEKRQLQLTLESEIAELKAHLRLFQKVDNWLSQGNRPESSPDHDALMQLDRISTENRQLKMSLTEAQTSLVLLQTELTQIKSHYEEKCQQLNSEREAVYELVDQQSHVHHQLDLLHKANRGLQDTNDSLRANLDWNVNKHQLGYPSVLSRPSSRQELSSQAAEGSQRPHPPEEATGTEGTWKNSGHSSLPVTESSSNMEPFGHVRMPSLRQEISAACSMHPARFVSPEFSAGSYSSTDPRLSLEPTGPAERTFKVVFAGDAAVGKSSFITRLHDGVFMSNVTTTLGVDFKVMTIRVDERNIAVQLWDTAGQERFRSITQSYFRKADGILMLFDVTNERSLLNVRQWMQSIRDWQDKVLPMVLCGTKSDLRPASEHHGRSCVDARLAAQMADELHAPYVETSAKTGTNVFDALVCLTRQMIISQDVEVQTSVLRLTDSTGRRSSCCGGRSAK